MLRSIALLGGLAAIATGCTQQAVAPPANANICPDPRPKACSMEYNPAIGYDKTGKRVGKFGNACNACGQDGVYYTLPEDGESR